MKQIALTFVAALMLTPAVSAAAEADYFPLGESHTWKYRVTRLIKGEEHQQKIFLASLPARTLGEDTFYPVRRLDDGIVIYQKTGEGIFRLDRNSSRRARILPAAITQDAKWAEDSSIHFLEVTGTFSPTFEERVQATMKLDHVVEATDDTVETAAGRFEHCLRVKATGSMFAGITLETFMGIRFIKVERTDWYAPGVGLVKRKRSEFTTPAEWNNEYLEELEYFE